MSLFGSYRIIKADDIIRANIRPDHISEDASSLINVLNPLTYIIKPEFPKASGLHANVIQKLDAKPHTLDLLKNFGYDLDAKGNYTYRSSRSDSESTARENAANEFLRFFNDIKKIKDDNLNGFQQYIRNINKRPVPNYNDNDDNYQAQSSRPTSRTSYHSPSPPPPPPTMPSFSKVKEGNDRTTTAIRSFKESIVPRHGGRAVHSFIRRKLLLLLYKQVYPNVVDFGDEIIDEQIEQSIARLRQQDRHRESDGGNEVYFECLIRANFDERVALDILNNKRPNLKPPPEPEQPRGPTTTTLATCIPHLRQHSQALNANRDENGAAQMLLCEGDEWKNAVHVVTAIYELRQKYNNQDVNDLAVSKMYRLIYTELSRIVRQQSSLKIELLSYALLKVPASSLEYLTAADLKDILRTTGNNERVSDDFQNNVIKSLSVECPICADTFPRSRMENMFLCNHTCCVTCAKEYYRNAIRQIRDSGALNKLTCFQESHEINDDIKLNFFQLLGAKLNQWFTDERLILEAYHENLFHATRDSETRKCGNQRCVGFFHINNNQIVRVQCPHCQFRQCQQCSRKWHDEHKGIDCEAYAEWLRENDPDDPEVQLTKYLRTAGMICPNEQCKAIYEYQAGGCEHFRCRQCNTEFCRICSALFYNPARNTVCPRPNCTLKTSVHAHCFLNCFREIRDAQFDEITGLLDAHHVNYAEELRQKPVATGPVCPVEDCNKAPSVACENRFCEGCYKQFLCLFVWRNQIPPWELYTDNNLRQKLTTNGVAVPANATRPMLLQLAQQHLAQFLGKPKEMPRIRQQ